MDQNIDKELNLKETTKSFIKKHKFKIILCLFLTLCTIIIFFIFKENEKKKNILVSEKYVKAGLLLSNKRVEEAKENYLDIILSNNDFYAISALNIVLEKDLVKDKDKILEYFKKLENANLSEELNDLLIFKKALYLLKLEDNDLAKKLLNGLIDKNSKFKKVAQELVSN